MYKFFFQLQTKQDPEYNPLKFKISIQWESYPCPQSKEQ